MFTNKCTLGNWNVLITWNEHFNFYHQSSFTKDAFSRRALSRQALDM